MLEFLTMFGRTIEKSGAQAQQLRNARTTSSATSLRSLDFQMQKKKIWKKEMGVFLKDRHKKETVEF